MDFAAMMMIRRRRGYVLLLTLLLIPVAAVALFSIERITMRRSLDASRESRELQRRWLLATCRTTLMRKIPAILDSAETGGSQPVLQRRAEFEIEGFQVAALFTDEQAKPNLNTLWATRDPVQCRDSLERLLRGSDLPINLQPTSRELLGLDGSAPFGSLSQVFNNAAPSVLMDDRNSPDRGSTIPITLWGSGKLNFHRASKESLEEICLPILGPADVQKILAIRKNEPAIGTVRLLNQLELSGEQRSQMIGRIVDRSNCFGMWMRVTDSDGTWWNFAVGTTGGAVKQFSW